MKIVLWFLLQIAFVLLAMLLAGRTTARRLTGAMLLLLALLLPMVAPIPPLPRALLASIGLLLMVKILQLDLAGPTAVIRRHLLWHGLAPFDIDSVRAVPPAVDPAALLAVIVYGFLAGLALIGLTRPWQPMAALVPLRLLLGTGLVYCGMETITVGLRFALRLVGLDVPPIQRAPILSLSISEFWSHRWNLPVSGWLNRFVFRPISRKLGLVLGTVATFAVSAGLHAWMFFVAVGWRGAAMAGSFFLLQAVLVLAERWLRVSVWRSWSKRAWTLGWLLASSPLFVLPVLQGLGLAPW